MSKILVNYWLLGPSVSVATFFVCTSAIAAQAQSNLEVARYSQEAAPVGKRYLETSTVADNIPLSASLLTTIENPTEEITDSEAESMVQITSVTQLSDVQPTDWAFQALRSLLERYSCMAGYPDGTYRGNRAMTRYEFAAGLNACMDKITQMLGGEQLDRATKEDLAILQRLQEEFAAELATLRSRVDVLEDRTAQLEVNQFSATTLLNAEVILALSGVAGDEKADNSNEDLEDNTIFSDRLRLNFDTSFTGKDLLKVRLQASNTTPFDGAGSDRVNVTGTDMTRLSFDGNNSNTIELSLLAYRFPVGDKTNISIYAEGTAIGESVLNFNTLISGSATGAISRFGRFNPLYWEGIQGSGIIVNHNFNKALSLSLAYVADEGENPLSKRGFFNGSYSAFAQLAFQPVKALNLGLTYVQSYDRSGNVNVSGSTGSALAKRPFGNETATFANHYGIEASVAVNSALNLAGWVGLTEAEAKSGANRGDNATVVNWAVTLAFPNLGKQGNLAGFVVGMPPKVTASDASEDGDTSLHLEGFYRFQLTDNIAITPGLLAIVNPEHNDANDTIYVGTIRTTFKF